MSLVSISHLSDRTLLIAIPGWVCVAQNEWYSQCLEGSGPPPASSTTRAPGSTTTRTTTAPTSTSTGGGGGGGSCTSAPVNQLVGYGAGTTGGGSGSGTTVTSCSAFESAVANGGVIRISGMLSGCDIVDVEGDTTVVGVGSNSGRSRIAHRMTLDRC